MRKPAFRRNAVPLLPTPAFAGLVFVLCAMWYAAASQSNAAVYLLLFALTAVFLVSIPHTLLNLGGLKVKTDSVKPTFAGQELSLPVEIINQSAASRYGISVNLPGFRSDAQRLDAIQSGKAARLILRFPALQRGEHSIEKLYLTSAYPIGFLRTAKHFTATQQYVVYPKPAGDPNLPGSQSRTSDRRPKPQLGEGDDFAGVRPYMLGESQRHIDWKAVARGHALATKQFATEPSGSLYLDFAAVPNSDPEHRLSQLALWIIQAERAHRAYGLRLPSTDVPASLGDLHFHRCLRALAMFK